MEQMCERGRDSSLQYMAAFLTLFAKLQFDKREKCNVETWALCKTAAEQLHLKYLLMEMTLPLSLRAGTPPGSPSRSNDRLETDSGPAYCHLEHKDNHMDMSHPVEHA